MNHRDENARGMRSDEAETLEPELREALGNFKASVDAWSESMMSRPREEKAPTRTNWDLLTKWALGTAVFVCTVSGGVYQSFRQQESAKVEAARIAEQQRQQAAQQAKEQQDSALNEEELMAKVDSDISREVPSALEPMASLMEDGNAGN